MKLSRYNHIFEHPTEPDKKIMCNYRTTALAVINPPQYEQFVKLADDSNAPLDEDLKGNLVEGGFILEDNIDEYDLMEVDTLRWRYATGNLTLTIAPTLNCNFRCVYCYEKDSIRNVKMTPEIQRGLLDFILEKAPTIRTLNITWYGGEPLLAWDVVVELTHEMQKICAENQIEYSASIITNGYLITEDMAKLFKDLAIENVQITLDGPKEVHDKRRILANGNGTFDKILKNVKILVDYTTVNIRINIDNENVKTLEDSLFRMFDENGLVDKIYICFGYVDAINEAYAPEKCLTMENYSQKHLEFLERNGIDIMYMYPHPIDNYCGADSTSTFVVGPEGNLYKCWSDIGIEDRKVGNVLTGEKGTVHNCLGMQYLLYNPIHDPMCRECEVLPLCKGGCPNKRLTQVGADRCSEHKYVIDEYFKTCIDLLIARQSMANKV